MAINPATPLAMVEEILDDADLFLIMTVNPGFGFGGQTFIELSLDRVVRMRRLLDVRSAHAELEVGVLRVAMLHASWLLVLMSSSLARRSSVLTQRYSRQLLSYVWLLPRRWFGERSSASHGIVALRAGLVTQEPDRVSQRLLHISRASISDKV